MPLGGITVIYGYSARGAPSAGRAPSVSGAPSAGVALSARVAPLNGKANISAIILFWLLSDSAPGLAARFTFSTCKTAFMSVAAAGCRI